MKVTTKGQVTIPAQIRDYLGITTHSEVDFRINNGTVVLVKHATENSTQSEFTKLRGILKGTCTTGEWMQATRGDM